MSVMVFFQNVQNFFPVALIQEYALFLFPPGRNVIDSTEILDAHRSSRKKRLSGYPMLSIVKARHPAIAWDGRGGISRKRNGRSPISYNNGNIGATYPPPVAALAGLSGELKTSVAEKQECNLPRPDPAHGTITSPMVWEHKENRSLLKPFPGFGKIRAIKGSPSSLAGGGLWPLENETPFLVGRGMGFFAQ